MVCVAMNIGSLRHRLALRKPSSTIDSMGQSVTTFATDSTVWGSLAPISGREMELAKQISEVIDYKAVIRHYADIETNWQILFDDRVFEIVHIANFEERNIYQTLFLREIK